MRRIRKIRADLRLLCELLKRSMGEYTSNCPPDMKIVWCWQEPKEILEVLWILVESKEFDEIPEGHSLPEWSPNFTRTNGGDDGEETGSQATQETQVGTAAIAARNRLSS